MIGKKLFKAIIPEAMRQSLNNALDWMRFQLWRVRHAQPVLQQPIFIIGCPRSGTSICADLFATHPDVAKGGGRLIWDPDHYFDPEADHCWGVERASDAARRYFHARFEYERQIQRKARFMSKHPRNSVRIDYLRAMFPEAIFLHITRDGRAVASSILKCIQNEPARQAMPFGNFCKPPDWRTFLRDDLAEQAALQWREIVRYILAKRETLSARTYFQFTYEAMCADTRKVFADLYAFAGLPVSDAMLSQLPETLPNMNYKYKQDLSPAQIETMTTVQHDLLLALDYDVTP